MKLKFIKSPTGAYNLAYNAGDVADVKDPIAKELVKDGFAEEIKKKKTTT